MFNGLLASLPPVLREFCRSAASNMITSVPLHPRTKSYSGTGSISLCGTLLPLVCVRGRYCEIRVSASTLRIGVKRVTSGLLQHSIAKILVPAGCGCCLPVLDWHRWTNILRRWGLLCFLIISGRAMGPGLSIWQWQLRRSLAIARSHSLFIPKTRRSYFTRDADSGNTDCEVPTTS